MNRITKWIEEGTARKVSITKAGKLWNCFLSENGKHVTSGVYAKTLDEAITTAFAFMPITTLKEWLLQGDRRVIVNYYDDRWQAVLCRGKANHGVASAESAISAEQAIKEAFASMLGKSNE